MVLRLDLEIAILCQLDVWRRVRSFVVEIIMTFKLVEQLRVHQLRQLLLRVLRAALRLLQARVRVRRPVHRLAQLVLPRQGKRHINNK